MRAQMPSPTSVTPNSGSVIPSVLVPTTMGLHPHTVEHSGTIGIASRMVRMLSSTLAAPDASVTTVARAQAQAAAQSAVRTSKIAQ